MQAMRPHRGRRGYRNLPNRIPLVNCRRGIERLACGLSASAQATLGFSVIDADGSRTPRIRQLRFECAERRYGRIHAGWGKSEPDSIRAAANFPGYLEASANVPGFAHSEGVGTGSRRERNRPPLPTPFVADRRQRLRTHSWALSRVRPCECNLFEAEKRQFLTLKIQKPAEVPTSGIRHAPAPSLDCNAITA